MAERGLLKLLAWLSPAMPVGAYSYSHGLEQATEAAHVRDALTLRSYIDASLAHGGARLDACWLRATHIATAEDRCEGWTVAEILPLAAAMRGTRELALESAAQGRALLGVLRAAWPAPALDELAAICRAERLEPPHACVLGVACAAHGIPAADAVRAFLHAFAANLVSAGIRLIPLGQTDGQRLIAGLEPLIDEVAAEVMAAPLADLGGAAWMIDLCSMAHETQYTRLFRS